MCQIFDNAFVKEQKPSDDEYLEDEWVFEKDLEKIQQLL